MLRFAAALLASAIATAGVSASARMHAPYRGHRILPGGALLDGGGSFSTAVTGAYSFRKLRSAYAGPAIRLRRASDNAELDINFLGCTGFTGCPWDAAAALAHCASTTCFAKIWYDQSGLAKNSVQVTAGNQPQVVFNCNGALPCLRATSGTQVLQTALATYVPVSPVSMSAVANRSAGTGLCYWPIQYNVNSFQARNTGADQWTLFAGAIPVAAADNAWHSGIAVMNGASSVVRIDGTETTGSVTVGTTAGALVSFWGVAAGTTCNASEVIVWDAYAMAPAERVVLGNNQKAFWGTP